MKFFRSFFCFPVVSSRYLFQELRKNNEVQTQQRAAASNSLNEADKLLDAAKKKDDVLKISNETSEYSLEQIAMIKCLFYSDSSEITDLNDIFNELNKLNTLQALAGGESFISFMICLRDKYKNKVPTVNLYNDSSFGKYAALGLDIDLQNIIAKKISPYGIRWSFGDDFDAYKNITAAKFSTMKFLAEAGVIISVRQVIENKKSFGILSEKLETDPLFAIGIDLVGYAWTAVVVDDELMEKIDILIHNPSQLLFVQDVRAAGNSADFDDLLKPEYEDLAEFYDFFPDFSLFLGHEIPIDAVASVYEKFSDTEKIGYIKTLKNAEAFKNILVFDESSNLCRASFGGARKIWFG